MRRIWGLCVCLLSGCGGAPSRDDAYKIWQGLEAAQVAAPLHASHFYADATFTPPMRCGQDAEATATALHTHAFSTLRSAEPDGSVSGHVDYALKKCHAAGVVLQGSVHRAFHMAERGSLQLGDERVPQASRRIDTFYGRVRLGSSSEPCDIEVVRTLTGDAATYQGALCGYPAAQLLGERNHTIPTELAP